MSSPALAVVIDYTTVPDGTYSSVMLGGTTVTGSNDIVSAGYVGFRGLGVVGGGADFSLDTGETMSIDFGTLATNTTVTLVDIDPPGNVTFSFEAFNGLVSLGVFAFPAAVGAPETYDLFALSGGQAMTSFTIAVGSPSAPLGLQIQGVSFDAVPEPGILGLLLIGFGALAHAVRRRNRS